MSGDTPCRCEKPDRARWVVVQRNCSHSAFAGYRYTPSAYSSVRCTACNGVWRTKAGYVDTLPDGTLFQAVTRVI
jgi:hypothetical protein